MQEDHDVAATVLDRAEQLSARTGPDHAVLLLALRSWGYIRWGRFDDARDLLEPLIATTIELGDLTVLGVVLNFYGQAVQALGEAEAADSLLRSALAEATDRGAVYPMILITVALALNDLESGRPKACRTMIAANRGAASQAGLVMGFMYDIVDAYAAVLEADWSAVRRSAVTAIEYADQLGSVWGKTFAATTDAVARRHLDDASGAEETAHAALRTADDKGFVPLIAECLELIAGIATDRESYEESARLFGAATAIRASVNMRTPRRSARELSNDYASLRNALGDDAFEHLRDQGALMDTAEAIAYASRARGERKRPSAGWESLTPRERDVVRLAAAGLTNPQIAEKLFIGRATVKAHLASVFGKLGVRTRAELASEATRRGNEQPAR
jgi:DNA-binding CsgD family transcriptional regulator